MIKKILPQMNEAEFNRIVEEVHDELMKEPEPVRSAFLLTGWNRYNLTDFHHSLGRHIRNTYNIWRYEWEPDLVDGVDHSKYHPDNISMEIIKAVWMRGNERITSD